ncbi:MAG: hydrogenase expression/formation protein HypE [Elusimicrobiota bacterium]|nr:hydrogenase expression/formation protein HypE [Endomicrobiia bacterium]MDW8165290.1 hydrogenase expression/formation protein HypE [Elusimicrobiota bacterium]
MNKILLPYGSGGKYTKEFIDRYILKYFNNKFLQHLLDSAVLEIQSEKLAFSIDGYTVSPLFFPGGDIGKLSICGTINDLLCVGADPKFIALSLIIEEGTEIEVVEKILSSIQQVSQQEDVLVVTGDTKVVEVGSCDKIFVTTAGVGCIRKGLNLHYNRIEPDDVIIITGNIAEHGLAILLSRGAYGFEYNIQSDCASLKSLMQKIFDDEELTPHIKFIRDPTRGGVAAVLNEIVSYRKDLGIEIYEEKVPISQDVKYLCELLAIEPFSIANEGKMIMITSKNVVDKILSTFKTHPLGKDAEVIGKVVFTNKGKVILKTLYGSMRILDMPTAEELPRIC